MKSERLQSVIDLAMLIQKGEPGDQGVKGLKGDRGEPGTKGDKGDPGEIGPQGLVGKAGNVGPAGPQGPSGQGVNWRGRWSPRLKYVEDDAVESEGSSYIAIMPSTNVKPPSSGWDLMAQKGAPGPAGGRGTHVISHGGGGSGSALEAKDEGVSLDTAVTSIDFAGAGVTASAVGHAVTVTIPSGGGAPTTADYLVGTADGGLSNEIVVGTTPGGELGGTWASPTVDATHSGSAHTDFIAKSFLDAKGDLITASADNTPSKLTVGADDTILMADAAQAGGLKWVASATPAAISTSGATGTSDTFTRGDHTHAHEAAHTAHDTVWDAAGDLVVGTGADTAAKLSITVPAANILEVLGVVNGETTATWKAVHDGTNPAAIGTAAAGTALTASHRDHVHATGAGTPSTQALGDAAATGSGPAAAMTDHKHAMPALSSATPLIPGIGAVGTALPSSREDHVHPAPIDEVIGAPHYMMQSTATSTANTASFIKFGVKIPVTVTKAYARITTASGNIDMGIYSSDGTTLTRVGSSGTTACPTAANNANVTLTGSVNLVPGVIYYAAVSSDNAVVSMMKPGFTPMFTGTGGGDFCGTVATSFPLPSSLLLSTLVNAQPWGCQFK